MRIAVVGATGLVGMEMIRVLEEFDIPVEELIPVASNRSEGKRIIFQGKGIQVCGMDEAIDRQPHYALFSAGAAVSREWAPVFASVGTIVVDNSSAWRKEKDIPLVVPEINFGAIQQSDRIIANPNCSTIQMVLVLAPLHRLFGVKRVVVATYQSVTGSGAKGMLQLENERKGIQADRFFPHRIDLNLIPQAGEFTDSGETTEEEKLAFETRKIIGDNNIKVTATAVRVPVYGGHSEAVNIECHKPFALEEIISVLGQTEGVTVQDDPGSGLYPMPLNARGSNEVYVGRIRRDTTVANGLNLWIVSDNLRKGAATNAVQIVSWLYEKKRAEH